MSKKHLSGRFVVFFGELLKVGRIETRLNAAIAHLDGRLSHAIAFHEGGDRTRAAARTVN